MNFNVITYYNNMIDNKYQIPKINKDSALPPANQLAKQLTWLLAEGIIAKGERLPSIREYAKVLGIHHHTVRAAYHLLEKNNLLSIKPGIGTIAKVYIPFISTPHNEYLDNELIAILVPGLTDFYHQIITGIEDVAIGDGLIPVVLNCHDDPIYAEAIFNNLSARNVKAVINISLGFSDEFHEKFSRKENLNIPLIFLDVIDSRTHSITIDTSGAIDLAAVHLLEHGYADLALINCLPEWPVGREALKGFRHALNTKGFSLKENSVFTVPNFGYEAGRFVIERMLQDEIIPRAILSVSDNLAIGAISALKDNGLNVPEDVAIVGFNDILPASFIDPPLTTMGLPLYNIGKETMLSLKKVLSGNIKNWIHKSFSAHLVIRNSCGCKNSIDEKGEQDAN